MLADGYLTQLFEVSPFILITVCASSNPSPAGFELELSNPVHLCLNFMLIGRRMFVSYLNVAHSGRETDLCSILCAELPS